MTPSEFFHFMEQWPRGTRESGSGCTPDACGWVDFTTARDVACAARLHDDGEIEVIASPGYATADPAAAPASESTGSREAQGATTFEPLKVWHDEQSGWTVSSRASDGLTLLAWTGEPPASLQEWDEGLARFDDVYARWAATLLAEPSVGPATLQEFVPQGALRP